MSIENEQQWNKEPALLSNQTQRKESQFWLIDQNIDDTSSGATRAVGGLPSALEKFYRELIIF